MKLTFFGHAALQIEVEGSTILVDPFISDNPLANSIVNLEGLDPDVILLTHAHGDHFGDTPAIARRTGALVVANYEITQYLLTHHQHDHVQPMNTGGAWDFPWGRVTQTWALHSSSFPDGTYGGNPGGYVLEAGGRCLYIAGDTSPFQEMKWIGEDFGIDLALLPIGDCFTMGPSSSIRAASLLQAARYMPVHFNTFPQIEVDTVEWVTMMKDAGHDTIVLNPGEHLQV